MAFETKAGLLVGVGFIVCFAVVLSHRGRGDEASARMAYHVLSQHGEKRVTRATTIPNAFARPRSSGHPLFRPAAREGVHQVDAGRLQPRRSAAAWSVGPDAALQRVSLNQKGRSAKTNRPASRHRPAKPTSDSNLHNARGRGAAAESTHDRRPALNEDRSSPAVNWESLFGSDKVAPVTAEPPTRSVEPPSPERTQVRAQLPRTAPPQERRYVVAQRDTLWGVARKAYGTANRAIVEAIYEANRDRLRSMDDLRPGMELALPHIERAGDAAETGVGQPAPARQQPSARPSRQHRNGAANQPIEIQYYNVQQGDRYATIAEKFLGDKARWPEIHALNKDIFPDPGRIQHGVRIRVPIRTATVRQ